MIILILQLLLTTFTCAAALMVAGARAFDVHDRETREPK